MTMIMYLLIKYDKFDQVIQETRPDKSKLDYKYDSERNKTVAKNGKISERYSISPLTKVGGM